MENVRNTELATRRPQSVSWRLWLAASLVILGLASCAGWYASGYMPGTLRIHTGARRVEAWGTGVHAIKYSTSAIQSQHWFVAGRYTKSRWYRPNGTAISETIVETGKPAKFYQLHEDGTVSDEFFLRDGIPDGRWMHFDRNGTLERSDKVFMGFNLDLDGGDETPSEK